MAGWMQCGALVDWMRTSSSPGHLHPMAWEWQGRLAICWTVSWLAKLIPLLLRAPWLVEGPAEGHNHTARLRPDWRHRNQNWLFIAWFRLFSTVWQQSARQVYGKKIIRRPAELHGVPGVTLPGHWARDTIAKTLINCHRGGPLTMVREDTLN